MLKDVRFWKLVSRISVSTAIIILVLLKFVLSQEQKSILFPIFMPIGIFTVLLIFLSEIILYYLKKRVNEKT